MSLEAPGFGVKYPSFAESLISQAPPPTYPSNPWGIPRASVGNKVTELQVNASANAYARAIPFLNGWEANYAEGMPLFVNNKRSSPGSPSVLAGTPAVVNYYLEEGARALAMASNTAQKRKRASLLEDYYARDHLFCDNTLQGVLNTWRFFGCIATMMGKGSESGFPGGPTAPDELILNCTVYKTAHILNYWGNVSDGDKIGWAIGLKRNNYHYFYDPNGNIAGDARLSPEYFLQIIPVTFGTQSRSISRNRNYKDLDNPMRDDIDFMARNMQIEQENTIINRVTGEFINTPLDLSKEVIKTNKLNADFYCTGAYVHVGTVNKGSRSRVRPSKYDLDLALRSNVKAQTLERIQVFVGC